MTQSMAWVATRVVAPRSSRRSRPTSSIGSRPRSGRWSASVDACPSPSVVPWPSTTPSRSGRSAARSGRRRRHRRGVHVIPDETVERVRESADIVAVIGEYVELKRQGTDYRGPCPFHQGTHRNFSVSPKKAMYYCFVCHEGGDVFNFLTKRLGVDWPTAVKMVAEKSGIEVVETQSRRAEQKDERDPLWEVNGAAAEYFRH